MTTKSSCESIYSVFVATRRACDLYELVCVSVERESGSVEHALHPLSNLFEGDEGLNSLTINVSCCLMKLRNRKTREAAARLGRQRFSILKIQSITPTTLRVVARWSKMSMQQSSMLYKATRWIPIPRKRHLEFYSFLVMTSST